MSEVTNEDIAQNLATLRNKIKSDKYDEITAEETDSLDLAKFIIEDVEMKDGDSE